MHQDADACGCVLHFMILCEQGQGGQRKDTNVGCNPFQPLTKGFEMGGWSLCRAVCATTECRMQNARDPLPPCPPYGHTNNSSNRFLCGRGCVGLVEARILQHLQSIHLNGLHSGA